MLAVIKHAFSLSTQRMSACCMQYSSADAVQNFIYSTAMAPAAQR